MNDVNKKKPKLGEMRLEKKIPDGSYLFGLSAEIYPFPSNIGPKPPPSLTGSEKLLECSNAPISLEVPQQPGSR
nr:8994_t:CDS:2 [Entrophospora candida]